jgi:mTERF domain-containing protein
MMMTFEGKFCGSRSGDRTDMWVNQLGWDATVIAKTQYILMSSLEKTIIPRAAVVQYLLSKGSRNKNASLTSTFLLQEKLFLDMFINCFM